MIGTHSHDRPLFESGLFVGLVALASLCGACSRKTDDGADAKVTTMGSIEVTADLVEIPGLEKYKNDFPSGDLGYDYAYIVKYRVGTTHRGQIGTDTILVAHYNPFKPRARAADDRPGCEEIGGNVERLRVGDVHRLALEWPIDDYYMGQIINPYFGQADAGDLYWALWTNRVIR